MKRLLISDTFVYNILVVDIIYTLVYNLLVMLIGGLKAAALTVGKDVECARSRYKKYLIGRFLYLYFKI